jgi:hypothetical protein
VLLPSTSLVAGAGKDGILFVLNGTTMGLVGRMPVSTEHENAWNPFVRAFGGGWPHVHGTPVAWQVAPLTVRLFVWPEHSPLTAVDVNVSNPSSPGLAIVQKGPKAPAESMPGGLLSLSLNESKPSTALLWATIPTRDKADALSHNQTAGSLRVFSAGDLSRELWNSFVGPFHEPFDQLGVFAKNAPPVVADGRVYVATFSNELAVYGLKEWATLITHSNSAPLQTKALGSTFTVLVSVQNTGARPWWTSSTRDRLQVRFRNTSTNAVVTSSEVPLTRDIDWNKIFQFDVSVPTPSVGGSYRVEVLWCTEVYEGRGVPWFLDYQAARTDSGRPRSSMRLRTVTAILVSVSCAGRLWERKVSPMMRLYRLIVPSTPALVL